MPPDYRELAKALALKGSRDFKAQHGEALYPFEAEADIQKQRMRMAQALMEKTNQYSQGPGATGASGIAGGLAAGLTRGIGSYMAGESARDQQAMLGRQEEAGIARLGLSRSMEAEKARAEAAAKAAQEEREAAAGLEKEGRVRAEWDRQHGITSKQKAVEDEAKATADKAKQSNDLAEGLRKEFTNNPVVREMQTVATAFQKIRNTAAKATPAGDVSLLTAYMKMLDPTSSVKEGEFATAEQATGVPGRILNLYNKAVSGQLLNPEMRADFLGQAEGLYSAQYDRFKPWADQFTGLSTRLGVPVENVVLDLGFAQPTKTKSAKQTSTQLPSDTVMVTPPGGGAPVPVHKTKLQDAIKAGGKVVGG